MEWIADTGYGSTVRYLTRPYDRMFTACDARLSSLGRVHHWQGLTELWCVTYAWHDRKMYTKIQLKLVMILKLQIHKNALWSAFWLGVANHGYSAIFHALRLSSHARFFARVRDSPYCLLPGVKMTSRFQPHPGDACTWVSRSRLLLRFWRRAQGARFIIRTTRSNRIWNSSQTWSFYRSQHLLCSHRWFRVQYLKRKGGIGGSYDVCCYFFKSIVRLWDFLRS